jgi:purine-nucleoside phosphorylase|tara:strand:- start:66 stop:509 length:444 start_codon:yes stop_codon:yes gene_type:complete
MKIRRAGILDISAIAALLLEMHNGTDIPTSKINSEKMISKISEAIHKGVCFISLNDENVIEGSIGGLVASDWWSEEKHLGDLWFYVTPEARKSNAAFELVREFKKVGQKVNIPVRLGHVFSKDLERKDKFFQRLGLQKAGSVFLEVA